MVQSVGQPRERFDGCDGPHSRARSRISAAAGFTKCADVLHRLFSGDVEDMSVEGGPS